MRDPRTRIEWRAVGIDRGQDADALLAAQRTHGSIYLYGYEAECYAKALICGDSARRVGRSHSLMDLAQQAGVDRQVLPPELLSYAESRDVAMRYRRQGPPVSDSETIDAARRFARFLLKRVDREERRMRQRKKLSIVLTPERDK